MRSKCSVVRPVQPRVKKTKIGVLGDGGVGKTSLCVRATEGIFQENLALTIGANVYRYELKTDQYWELMLFDLGGQDAKEAPNADVFVRGSAAIILVYDMSSILSFFSLDADWLPFIQQFIPKVPIIVVGSKLDVEPEQIEVPEELIEAFITKNSGPFNLVSPSLQVSAKTGHNLEQMMHQVVESITLYQTLGISEF